MPNYAYVIDSSFQPFSMQEMLVPFTAYKDAFEKTEEAYMDLSDKSDKFKYLSETLPEGSKARQLYEGYANDLQKQAEDLAHNGLSMSNRRALTSLKRRYQGEIGRINKADEALREEKKLRQTLNAQDSSRLYAIDNLNIDDFLDGGSPNLYNISGNELYSRGAAAGKAASSRVFSAGDAGSTLNGYYRDYVQKLGYNADTIRKFYEDMSSIPELQMAADSILEERGVNQNLTGANLARARKAVLNGMIDGAVYQENHNPQRDLGVLTAAEKAADARAQQQFNLQKFSLDAKAASMGYKVNDDGKLVIDPERMKALKELKAAGKKGSKGSGMGAESMYETQSSGRVKISWRGNNPNDTNGEADDDIKVQQVSDDTEEHPGKPMTYDELPTFVKQKVNKVIGIITNPKTGNIIGGGDPDLYQYYYQPFIGRGIWNDTEAEVEIVPMKVTKYNGEEALDFSLGGGS